MNSKYKTILLCTACSFLLVACSPKKNEDKKAEEIKVAPVEKVSPSVPEKKNEKGLTPHQQEELKINEDNVMNPIPG